MIVGASFKLIAIACMPLTSPLAAQSPAKASEHAAAVRAQVVVDQMTAEEKLIMTHGIIALPLLPNFKKAG